MSIKRIKPHDFGIDEIVSGIGLKVQSQSKAQSNLQKEQDQNKRKLRLLSLIVNSLYVKKVAFAFRTLRFQPLRVLNMRKSLTSIFRGLVHRSEYKGKIQGFQSLKRYFIERKNEQIKKNDAKLMRAKISTITLLRILLNGKEKNNLREGLGRIVQTAKQRYQDLRQKYRKGFRIWIKVSKSVTRESFFKLRNSRYLIEIRLKLQTIGKIVNEHREMSLRLGMNGLRRNLYFEKQNLLKKQIAEIERRIQREDNEELNDLMQKKQKLQQGLIEIKQQKQQISRAYQKQVKQAETQNTQIQARMTSLRQQNQSLIQQISQITTKLKENFTMDEIFQMFYNNFLLYLTKHKNAPLVRTQMLEELTKPLIPVGIPLDALKEENKVMKELLVHYVLMYGQKSLYGQQLQIPYEYLVKENQIMYKALLTLLPRLNYDKKQVLELRQSLDSVEKIVKQLRM